MKNNLKNNLNLSKVKDNKLTWLDKNLIDYLKK